MRSWEFFPACFANWKEYKSLLIFSFYKQLFSHWYISNCKIIFNKSKIKRSTKRPLSSVNPNMTSKIKGTGKTKRFSEINYSIKNVKCKDMKLNICSRKKTADENTQSLRLITIRKGAAASSWLFGIKPSSSLTPSLFISNFWWIAAGVNTFWLLLRY